jgi:hypothetical protein
MLKIEKCLEKLIDIIEDEENDFLSDLTYVFFFTKDCSMYYEGEQSGLKKECYDNLCNICKLRKSLDGMYIEDSKIHKVFRNFSEIEIKIIFSLLGNFYLCPSNWRIRSKYKVEGVYDCKSPCKDHKIKMLKKYLQKIKEEVKI